MFVHDQFNHELQARFNRMARDLLQIGEDCASPKDLQHYLSELSALAGVIRHGVEHAAWRSLLAEGASLGSKPSSREVQEQLRRPPQADPDHPGQAAQLAAVCNVIAGAEHLMELARAAWLAGSTEKTRREVDGARSAGPGGQGHLRRDPRRHRQSARLPSARRPADGPRGARPGARRHPAADRRQDATALTGRGPHLSGAGLVFALRRAGSDPAGVPLHAPLRIEAPARIRAPAVPLRISRDASAGVAVSPADVAAHDASLPAGGACAARVRPGHHDGLAVSPGEGRGARRPCSAADPAVWTRLRRSASSAAGSGSVNRAV